MTDTVAQLFALQQFQFGADPGSSRRLEGLRRSIPADLLAKYDRLASRGKKPIAVVRNGVCGNCHVGLAVGVLFAVSQGRTVACDNCGRFLHLPATPSQPIEK